MQGLEGYVAIGSDVQARSILQSAINDIFATADTCRHMESKEKLYDISARVGAAVGNTGLGLLSAISMEVGRHFRVKQALVASIFAPHVMRFNARNDHRRTNPSPTMAVT
jgi:alcohol dehydrogenase class IV